VLVERARASRSMLGADLARAGDLLRALALPAPREVEPRFRVVAYDFGMKRNICACWRRPAASDGRAGHHQRGRRAVPRPHGIFLSNGPGTRSRFGSDQARRR